MIADTLARNGPAGLHERVHEVPLGIPFLSLKVQVYESAESKEFFTAIGLEGGGATERGLDAGAAGADPSIA